ncbi:hypothetical protein [uncultured Methanoregula sp.]|uniref:hypothetical protein n=1 Tax=uncultured Methanoregula sp. TaxID=1005933 RepID=UPI002AAABBCA|nr:hypothetical protein [uncultured Methanoregula sp.]
MTRGRPPLKAAKAAHPCARERGSVVELTGACELPADFYIVTRTATIFVKVKRVRAKVAGEEDAAIQFRPLIRSMRLLPQGPVTFIELWGLSPHQTWQYFRILPDRIIEIRGDGSSN